MWNEPYLETCCRSALHRLRLSGEVGRPSGYKDGPCLARLVGLGFAEPRDEASYTITVAGVDWHRQVIRCRGLD